MEDLNMVTMTGEELREYFNEMTNEEQDLFFTLLAVGKSGEFAKNYVLTERR